MVHRPPNPDNTGPYISIIIPVHNAHQTLVQCLNAIFDSTFKNFEVLIVDDDSQDDSVQIAEAYPCRILRMPRNQGPAVARNSGAKNAEGKVLLFIDSDIVIQSNTLDLFVNSLKRYAAVFGIYTQKPGSNKLLSLYQNFYAHKSIKETRAHTSMLYSYCAAIKKEVFFEVGGFNENWPRATFEDVEFGMRLTEKGHRIYLNKDIQVVHHANFNVKRFVKNYFYKSLDLSKFMFSKKRITLNNEGWTNKKNLLGFLAGILFIPLFVSAIFCHSSVGPVLICGAVFLAINLDFYRFILRERPAQLLGAFSLNLLVQVVSGLGIAIGLASFIKEKGTA